MASSNMSGSLTHNTSVLGTSTANTCFFNAGFFITVVLVEGPLSTCLRTVLQLLLEMGDKEVGDILFLFNAPDFMGVLGLIEGVVNLGVKGLFGDFIGVFGESNTAACPRRSFGRGRPPRTNVLSEDDGEPQTMSISVRKLTTDGWLMIDGNKSWSKMLLKATFGRQSNTRNLTLEVQPRISWKMFRMNTFK